MQAAARGLWAQASPSLRAAYHLRIEGNITVLQLDLLRRVWNRLLVHGMRRELQLSEAQAEGLTMEWKGDGTMSYPQLDSLELPLAARQRIGDFLRSCSTAAGAVTCSPMNMPSVTLLLPLERGENVMSDWAALFETDGGALCSFELLVEAHREEFASSRRACRRRSTPNSSRSSTAPPTERLASWTRPCCAIGSGRATRCWLPCSSLRRRARRRRRATRAAAATSRLCRRRLH